MKKRSFVAILKKHSDLQELIAAARHSDPAELVAFVPRASLRIDFRDVQELLAENLPGVSLKVVDADLADSNDIAAIRAAIGMADVLALHVHHHRKLLKGKARKAGVELIHLSDGICDAYSVFEYFSAQNKNMLLRLFRSCYWYFAIKYLIADLCFSAIYPKKNTFSKLTLPAANFPTSKRRVEIIQKLQRERSAKTFIVAGYGMSANSLASRCAVENYVATTKSKQLVCNDQVIETGCCFCAEEIISVLEPAMIVGAPSTVLIWAKLNFPAIEVICIEPEEGDHPYPSAFFKLFRIHARSAGVIYQ